MLSYRHSFHAGNHADVLKHLCLFLILDYYKNKQKPFTYIDTHAGAGLYKLDSKEARLHKEFYSGINRLLNATTLPPTLEKFRKFIMQFCDEYNYIGSPFIAANLLNNQDKVRLFELHPNDYEILKNNCQTLMLGRRLKIENTDGLQGLLALLPPNPRRAIVLIDPSYEVKNDYKNVLLTLNKARHKFNEGCFMVWYPILSKIEMREFIHELSRKYKTNYLKVELNIQTPNQNGFGMFGSGVFILNPPFQLQNQLAEIMPFLTDLLKTDSTAKYILEGNII